MAQGLAERKASDFIIAISIKHGLGCSVLLLSPRAELGHDWLHTGPGALPEDGLLPEGKPEPLGTLNEKSKT